MLQVLINTAGIYRSLGTVSYDVQDEKLGSVTIDESWNTAGPWMMVCALRPNFQAANFRKKQVAGFSGPLVVDIKSTQHVSQGVDVTFRSQGSFGGGTGNDQVTMG